MHDQDLHFLIELVRSSTGIQLDVSKSYLLQSRLNPLLRVEGMKDLHELCNALRGSGARRLLPQVIDAMTTNETSFFRDSAPFQQLAREVFPGLLDARRQLRKLRIWSAACSSGQEAVSLAILMAEHFPELRNWDVRILATDVSPAMVARCRAATFTENEMGRGMPPELRQRYFDRTESGWQAKREIRDLLHVREVNLIQPLVGVETQDLVLLRNVLIYFDEPTREKIFQGITRVLAPDGFLLLGTAEKPRSDGYERAFGPNANVFRKAA
ncbi:Chemotaxis protein methyltransferase Cher2 [Planctomycetes bacterium Poly30]|uniref:protein-glutamate O-methyltransferase n=1 Tax=Saltatorellus ferox TaxID=2528018 RepID=A0A518F0T0_9BACT|nr:Chemotaxis protein methyltransferase Cher2 [Planctomycetes bacterium Poly30]